MDNFMHWLMAPNTPELYAALFVVGVILFGLSFMVATLMSFGILGVPIIAVAFIAIVMLAYRGRSK